LEVKIVQKGSKEFNRAKQQYLELFTDKYPRNTIQSGGIGCKTTQKELLNQIQKPFSCPDLELYIFDSEAVTFFCGRIGCLCSCCIESLEGDYPLYCPDPNEPWSEDCDDDDLYDDEDYYNNMED